MTRVPNMSTLRQVPRNVVTFSVEVTKHPESIAVRSSGLADGLTSVPLHLLYIQSLIVHFRLRARERMQCMPQIRGDNFCTSTIKKQDVAVDPNW